MDLDTDQIVAVETACANRFAMITGGAGTGKTTIIKEIATRMKQDDKTVNLCAFAGKAAARLREATGYEATTIHRLLMYTGSIFMAGNLHGRHVIVDEASMIASDLMAEIIRREPASLTLVGDPSQLPPVGKGQPFHDLLRLKPDTVCDLATCYRNSEAVYKAATAIRAGKQPLSTDRSDNEKWDICRTGDAKATHEVILEYVRKEYIDFSQDIILVPRNGDSEDTPCSVRGLNADIVDILNPRQDGEPWLAGDRVICTKNFSESDLWNGTTAKIDSIDAAGYPWLKLDIPIIDAHKSNGSTIYKDTILLDKDQRKALQLAYALTVHKAQGSQYRRVIFVALKRDSFALLDRSLIYTAVTRAREQCVVMGQYEALIDGIETVRDKRTVIQELAGGRDGV